MLSNKDSTYAVKSEARDIGIELSGVDVVSVKTDSCRFNAIGVNPKSRHSGK